MVSDSRSRSHSRTVVNEAMGPRIGDVRHDLYDCSKFEGRLFQAISRDQELLPFKRRLRQLGQKTARSLDFDVNAFGFIGGKGWRSLLGAKLATNFSRRFTME